MLIAKPSCWQGTKKTIAVVAPSMMMMRMVMMMALRRSRRLMEMLGVAAAFDADYD
jgi:hypothetical protein